MLTGSSLTLFITLSRDPSCVFAHNPSGRACRVRLYYLLYFTVHVIIDNTYFVHDSCFLAHLSSLFLYLLSVAHSSTLIYTTSERSRIWNQSLPGCIESSIPNDNLLIYFPYFHVDTLHSKIQTFLSEIFAVSQRPLHPGGTFLSATSHNNSLSPSPPKECSPRRAALFTSICSSSYAPLRKSHPCSTRRQTQLLSFGWQKRCAALPFSNSTFIAPVSSACKGECPSGGWKCPSKVRLRVQIGFSSGRFDSPSHPTTQFSTCWAERIRRNVVRKTHTHTHTHTHRAFLGNVYTLLW